MATTTDLAITLWTALQNSPDATVNDAIKVLEAASHGQLIHNMTSDADYTLLGTGSIPYEWQNALIHITDTGVVLSTGRNIIVPDRKHIYHVFNDTAQTLTFKTSAGSGVPVATTDKAIVWCDGTDVLAFANAL